MAWTAPATAVTGDVIPAAFWNTNGRDNLNFIYLKRVVELTNRSGASVAAGDVVILDTANDSSFTTTATANVVGAIGVADETIANAALGKVQVGGLATVATTGVISRGNRLATSTTDKRAKGSTAVGAGDFAAAATAHAGPTGSVTALLFGGGAGGVGLDGIATQVAITAAAGTASTASRSDHVHDLATGVVKSTKVDLTLIGQSIGPFETTTSTSYVDLTTVGPSATAGPGVISYLVFVTAMLDIMTSTIIETAYTAPKIGVNTPSDNAALRRQDNNGAGFHMRATLASLQVGITDGTVIKMQYRVSGGTGEWGDRKLDCLGIRGGT